MKPPVGEKGRALGRDYCEAYSASGLLCELMAAWQNGLEACEFAATLIREGKVNEALARLDADKQIAEEQSRLPKALLHALAARTRSWGLTSEDVPHDIIEAFDLLLGSEAGRRAVEDARKVCPLASPEEEDDEEAES